MSYFPKAILPGSDKKNIVGFSGADLSGTILADDYNEHNGEIQAIETFLGTESPTSDQVGEMSSLSAASQNMLGMASYLANALSRLSACCSSGSVHSGRRISFPYGARAAFLMQPLDTGSKTISVSSTDGFPTTGVVSILNDTFSATAQNAVEWISYGGKTGDQFLGCLRGDFGTVAGDHGSPVPTPGTLNDEACQPLSVAATACDARYQAWATRNLYSFAEFGLADDLVPMKRNVRLRPGSYSLSPETLGPNYDSILKAARDAGILSTSPLGEPVLKSANAGYAALGQLAWLEASGFVDSLVSAGVVALLKAGAQWDVGNSPFVPVFGGRMGVSYSIAAATLSPSSASSRTFLQDPVVSQTADGTVTMAMRTATTKMIQGIIQYKTFFVSSVEGA